jgi:hypothetical protein
LTARASGGAAGEEKEGLLGRAFAGAGGGAAREVRHRTNSLREVKSLGWECGMHKKQESPRPV